MRSWPTSLIPIDASELETIQQNLVVLPRPLCNLVVEYFQQTYTKVIVDWASRGFPWLTSSQLQSIESWSVCYHHPPTTLFKTRSQDWKINVESLRPGRLLAIWIAGELTYCPWFKCVLRRATDNCTHPPKSLIPRDSDESRRLHTKLELNKDRRDDFLCVAYVGHHASLVRPRLGQVKDDLVLCGVSS